jgi:hypothetical protein
VLEVSVEPATYYGRDGAENEQARSQSWGVLRRCRPKASEAVRATRGDGMY